MRVQTSNRLRWTGGDFRQWGDLLSCCWRMSRRKRRRNTGNINEAFDALHLRDDPGLGYA